MTNELVLLRRRHGLTQTELANLIGISQTSMGQLEMEDSGRIHHLRLETAFGMQVVFGVRPEKLFRALFCETEEEVMRNAGALDRQLDGQTDRVAETKRALLADMVRRAGNRPILP